MSSGFLILAQNSDIDYVRQAYALALSIKNSQSTIKSVTLVTNDNIKEEYARVFDNIVPIPFGDSAQNSEWKVENRWKLFYASPYEETIVLDADMLVLEDLNQVWKFVKERDLFFTNKVVDYKGRVINDTVYRKMFKENDLPNVYCGMFYFKKSELSITFFKLLEFITNNWQRVFYEVAPKSNQKFFSMDVASSIACKILGIDDQVVNSNSPFSFVHMKTALQGWDPIPLSYLSQSLINFNDSKQLWINNFQQHGIFHYVENEFLTDDIIGKLSV